jgi:hypothetical protein
MIRLNDWQSRLSEYLTSCAQQRFRYGVLDCGLFVAGAIAAMTDVDVAAELRGKYSSRREAFASIQRLCGRPTMPAVADYLAARFEIAETPVAFAQRGDPVQLRRGRAASLGLVAMHGTEILTPFADGLLRLPISHATRAWHI